MSESFEEQMESEKTERKTMWEMFAPPSMEERLRPATRRNWERVARQVWSGKEDISALEGCPLPVGLLAALQVYEKLCAEYDQGEKEATQPETGLRG